MSLINTILNAVQTLLINANTAAGSRVFRRLEEPLGMDESPALDVRYQGDTSSDMGGMQVKREIFFEVAALSRSATPESDALELMAVAHNAIMQDRTLGGLVALIGNDRGEAQSDDAEVGACLVSRQYRAICNSNAYQL